MNAVEQVQERILAGEDVAAAELVEARAQDELDEMRARMAERERTDSARQARVAEVARIRDGLAGADAAMIARVLEVQNQLGLTIDEIAAAYQDRQARIIAANRQLHELGEPGVEQDPPKGITPLSLVAEVAHSVLAARGQVNGEQRDRLFAWAALYTDYTPSERLAGILEEQGA
jgi:hypothetical protein